MFVLNPASQALLLKGTNIGQGIWVVATSFIGIFSLSAAASGWLLKKCSTPERFLLIGVAFALIHPGYWSDAAGLALLGAIAAFQFFAGNDK
jgi:TRAP-type uncharacterized transport system fused permease subunit